jgi:DNA-binding transcriptional LysR family regulator
LHRTRKSPTVSIDALDGSAGSGEAAMLDRLTLDQLRILVAIAEAGSFTAAARRLGRAQSVVSHAVAGLEAELEVGLFERSGRGRRLTAAGAALLADARLALARVDALRARARGLASGLEPRLALAVSVLCPRPPLMALLGELEAAFPALTLEMFVEEIGGAAALVLAGSCTLALVGRPSLGIEGADRLALRPAGEVAILAVAHREHPLARLGRALEAEDLAEHRQLVPGSRARAVYPNRLAAQVWEVADLNLRRELVLAGLGWGTFPAHLVQDDLADGRLVRLALVARAEAAMRVALFVVHRADATLGPAGRWLRERLVTLVPAEEAPASPP